MKRNRYSNSKSSEPSENKRVPPKIFCMECGSSHGTLRKVKKPDGTRGYLCQYCFDDFNDEE